MWTKLRKDSNETCSLDGDAPSPSHEIRFWKKANFLLIRINLIQQSCWLPLLKNLKKNYSSNPFRYQKKKNSQPQPFMRLKHFKETPCITIFSFSHLFSFRCIPLIFYAGIELNETHLGEKSFSPHSQKAPKQWKDKHIILY